MPAARRLAVEPLEPRLAPAGTPPTIADIPDRSVVNTEFVVEIPVTVGDAESPAETLTVTATSSNPEVVRDDALFVGGFAADRTVTIPLTPDRTGTTTITVRVADPDGEAAEDSFALTVTRPPITIPAGRRVPAGEFNWFQATPDGTLAQPEWAHDVLVYRTRAGTGWAEEAVAVDPFSASRDGYPNRDAVQRATQAAQLLFGPDGPPHAFLAGFEFDGSSPQPHHVFIDHYARTGGRWDRADRITVDRSDVGGQTLDNLTGAVGPGGVFHLLASQGVVSGGRLVYVTNKSGGWAAEPVTATGFLGQDVLFNGGRYAPRFLSIAADSQNNAHVAYTPRFEAESFGRVFSQLAYATNRGGSWQSQVVYSPPDGTGDAGAGASIAVGPGDQVAIANYLVDRVDTGSPAAAQLLYHARRADGGWDTQTVAAAPDGYAGNDGPKFTGFSPHLVFRGGTPVITFSDLAGSHLPATSANEMSGQIRTATAGPGGWALATVFRQGSPLTEQVFFPLMVEFRGQPVFAAVRAVNHVDGTGELTGWESFDVFELDAPSIAPVGPGPGTPGGPPGAGVVGADAGGGPVVQVFAPDGSLRFQAMAFEPSFTGGVRVASADFTADGTPDVVVGTGPGRATRVRVLDGADQRELFTIDPFEASFTGGVYVAAGDLTGDGQAELVITPDEGGGPRVRVFNGSDFSQLADFFGIDDPNFRGGARAAIGDISGDGAGDLVVAAGFQGGPRVAGFDGRTLGGTPARVFGDFFAFEETLRNGVFVAVGDIDADGFAELIAGGGPGGGPRVTAFSGKALLDNRYDVRANFFAGDEANRGGVRLAVQDLDGDDRADLVTGAGAGAGSRVTAYLGRDLGLGTPPPARDFDAFAGFTGGVFVG
jgi:hypothetical protein